MYCHVPYGIVLYFVMHTYFIRDLYIIKQYLIAQQVKKVQYWIFET